MLVTWYTLGCSDWHLMMNVGLLTTVSTNSQLEQQQQQDDDEESGRMRG